RALVVLEVVDGPRREGLRVGRLVAEAPHALAVAAVDVGAGLVARDLVDPDLQPLAVDVVGERGHTAGELGRVPFQLAARIASVHPAIVEVHVLVTDVLHPARDEDVGNLLDKRLVQVVAPEGVPRVPPHRRRRAEEAAPRRTTRATATDGSAT